MPANRLVAGMVRSYTCKIMVVFNALWNYMECAGMSALLESGDTYTRKGYAVVVRG